MYQPVIGSLPAVGTARETETLDFKARLNRLADASVDQVGIALPVAAFANRVGGTLLYGAAEGSDGTVTGYAPLSSAEAAETLAHCDQAIKERCDPVPLWSHAVIAHATGSALAINIEPYAGGIVAVRVSANKAKGMGGDAYVFPMRVGTHTQHLTAGQIPMFMDPRVRRTIILLSKIRTGEPVWVRDLSLPRGTGARATRFSTLEENLNRVVLGDDNGEAILALDAITSVFAANGGWVIVALW